MSRSRSWLLLVALAIAVVGGVPTFAGGTGEGGSSAKPQFINVQLEETPRDRAVVNYAVPAFEKKYGIKVNMEISNFNQQRTQLVLEFGEKSPRLDVIGFPDNFFAEFQSKSWLAPIDQYYENAAAVQAAAKDQLGILYREPDWSGLMQNKMYMVPYVPGAIILFYRTDVFEKAGLKPPQTTAEWEAAAKKLNDPANSFYGISISYSVKDNQLRGNWEALIGAFGGNFFDKTWHSIFNQQPGIDTALFLKRMLQYCPPSALQNTYSEAEAVFLQGNAAMLLLWSHASADIMNPTVSKVVGKVAAIALPAGPVGKSGLAADEYLAVNAFSKKKEWAAKFIQVVNDPAMVRELWDKGFVPPARVSIATDPEVVKTLFIGPAMAKTYEVASGYPRITMFEPYFTTEAQTALSAIMTTDQDPKKLLDALAVDMDGQLKQAGYRKD